MKELHKGAITQILLELDRSFLTRHAFDTSFNNENGEIVKLTFRENPGYFFIIYQASEKDAWKTIESPGLYFTTSEEYDLRDFNSCRSRLASWIQRIIEELTISGNTSEDFINMARRNWEEYANSLPDPDIPFTQDEATEWSKKLEEIIERLKKLEKENKIQQGKLNRLEQELEILKNKITEIPKRIWVKAMGNRIFDFLGSTAQEEVKSLVDSAIQGLLPGK